jgi:hypothetical protein
MSRDRPKQLPLLGGQRTVEEAFARIAYRGYEIEGHGSQSFERVYERGGFAVEELIHWAFVAGRGKPVEFGKELES